MAERNPFSGNIENALNVAVLGELAAEHAWRRRPEGLKDMLGGYSPYGRIPPSDRRG
jgi:hypothetical protein